MKSLIIIPSRMASSRLPNKPLADIAGKPMIAHVYAQAQKVENCDILVACDGQEIFDVITNMGGKAVITDPDLPSGTDRIYAALQAMENGASYDIIINVQGDLPLIDPDIIRTMDQALRDDSNIDISTAVAEIHEESELASNAVVKVAVHIDATSNRGRALYFSRNIIPWGEGPIYHHIGIYGYRRAALEKFVASTPSALEQRESLEQLRALEQGMYIAAIKVPKAPLGVDRPEDLETVRKWMRDHG